MASADEPTRRARVFDIFDGAVSLPESERAAWIEQQAMGDAELAGEVAALLAAHEAPGLLDRPLRVRGVSGETAETVAKRCTAALFDRYDDFELVGEGGMSFVYRATEKKHDRPVVLKVLRPEVAAAYGEARFLREVQLASKLSHPHILPLIDSGRADGLLYYVMPHTDGETLHARLSRIGALAPPRACPLLRDLADAMAYAHGRGVVHRDLKPANVLCVDDHAYLMDFGVAKLLSGKVPDGLTRPGHSPGTPQYMAPEQLDEGQDVGAAADVFAWGQLAHQTLTGTLVPSVAGASVAVGTRLGGVEGLGEDWVRAIAQALSADSEARPDSSELFHRLQASSGPARQRRSRRRRGWVAATLLGVLGVTWWNVRSSRVAPLTEGLATPIAVAPFRNETGDASLDFVGRLAGDWITQGVRTLGSVVVPWSVSRDVVERVGGDTATDQVLLLGSELGAGTVITGRFYRVGEQLSFTADVTTADGLTQLVATDPVTAPIDRVEDALSELRDRIMGGVSVLTGERTADIEVLANRAPTLEAYRAFDRGLAHYLAQEYNQATPAFLQAFDRDTTFLTTLLYAAATAQNQGDGSTADSLLSLLEPRRDRLSRYDDLRWQAHTALLRGEMRPALRALRQATSLAPFSRAAYNLALVATQLNRPQEALEALNTLDPDGGEIRGWAQYWTQKTHALHLLGRHGEEADAAAEMVRRYPERTVAPVLLVRGAAAAGDVERLEEVLSSSALRAARTYWSHGGALTVAGEELLSHGSAEAAAPYLRRAEQWLDAEIARDPDYTAHRYWKASVLYDQQRWPEAAAAAARLVEVAPDNGTYVGMLAVSAARLGDSERAERLVDADWWPGDEGGRLIYSARIQIILGNHERALRDLSDALEHGVSGLAWTHATSHHEFAELRSDERFRRLFTERPAA